MSTIKTGTGLASGLNITEIVDALVNAQKGTVNRLTTRAEQLQKTVTGVDTLEANVLTIGVAAQKLGFDSTFKSFKTTNSDATQLAVTTTSNVAAGEYEFRAVRKAQTHELLSRGFASEEQIVGAGTLTIATGGELNPPTLLDALNSGNGVRLGTVRITDRSGAAADIDLSAAVTVADVLAAVNAAGNISVSATAAGDRLVFSDTSGGAGNLTIADVGSGRAAADLGIAGTTTDDTLTGSAVYTIFGGLTLDQINDGNGLRLSQGAADLRLTFTDDSTLEVNLDGAKTLDDVVAKINTAEGNDGRASAELVNGRLELTDLTGGGGTSAFTVADVNASTVVRQLGLDATANGTTLTGRRLTAGIDSVLLRNLNGGSGVTAGVIRLTDRTGTTADVDLSAAETLDEVLSAINSAESVGSIKLQLVAELDATGTGIQLRDTSGATASNLIVTDISGSLAADLKLTIDAATDTVTSGSLSRRYVHEGTSLNDFAPDGEAVKTGSILITDSAGQEEVVSISSAVKSIGDVIDRINATSTVSVRAELNETGDGFVIIDEADGLGVLSVSDLSGGTTAADLRLTGAAVLGDDNQYYVSSRQSVVVELDADDTLADLRDKLNTFSGTLTAALVDDGSPFNPLRLDLRAARSGSDSRLIVTADSWNLGFNTVVEGADALLAVRGVTGQETLLASDTNTFTGVVPGMNVNLLKTSDSSASVVVQRDIGRMTGAIQGFVDAYNTVVSAAAELTKFDFEGGVRGVLQGNSLVLRVQQRLESIVTRQVGEAGDSFRRLLDLGVRFTTGGKLTFDSEQFEELAQADPDTISDFFLNQDTGFGHATDTTLDTLTDPFTGTFTLETNSLQESVDSLTARIGQLNAILEVRRNRLLEQFVALETVISNINSQQQALAALSPLNAK